MGRIPTLKSQLPQLHKTRHGWADQSRGTAAERGYGADWQRLRAETMREQHGLCQPCLRRGRVTPAVAVDHRVPKARGGTDHPTNRQCICRPCHTAKTAAEARGLEWDEADPIGAPGAA